MEIWSLISPAHGGLKGNCWGLGPPEGAEFLGVLISYCGPCSWTRPMSSTRSWRSEWNTYGHSMNSSATTLASLVLRMKLWTSRWEDNSGSLSSLLVPLPNHTNLTALCLPHSFWICGRHFSLREAKPQSSCSASDIPLCPSCSSWWRQRW